jgi:glutaminase
MNSESGTWAFDVGVPAKSGMSGGLLLVVPNICGIAIWSPRVQEHANSVRGVEFAKELVKRYGLSPWILLC